MKHNELMELENQYMNRVTTVFVNFRPKPVNGRIKKITDEFITLERVSGDISIILQSTILAIYESHDVTKAVV